MQYPQLRKNRLRISYRRPLIRCKIPYHLRQIRPRLTPYIRIVSPLPIDFSLHPPHVLTVAHIQSIVFKQIASHKYHRRAVGKNELPPRRIVQPFHYAHILIKNRRWKHGIGDIKATRRLLEMRRIVQKRQILVKEARRPYRQPSVDIHFFGRIKPPEQVSAVANRIKNISRHLMSLKPVGGRRRHSKRRYRTGLRIHSDYAGMTRHRDCQQPEGYSHQYRGCTTPQAGMQTRRPFPHITRRQVCGKNRCGNKEI